jgi:uncharacterized protein
MALLVRSPLRAPSASPRNVAPTIAVVDGCVEVRLGGVIVAALPEGALWVEDGGALIVADLHFEKGSALAKGGQLIPPYDTRATLERLAALIEEHEPEIVVSLGDAFHDGGGPARMGEEERALLQALVRASDWIWVEGNHEGKSAETLGGVARETLQLGALALRHEPTRAVNEIAGHLHPCAKIAGNGRNVRRRCFATDGTRMVLPAFGAYAGGLNICDAAFAPVFPQGAAALVLGKDRVLPILPERLIAD